MPSASAAAAAAADIVASLHPPFSVLKNPTPPTLQQLFRSLTAADEKVPLLEQAPSAGVDTDLAVELLYDYFLFQVDSGISGSFGSFDYATLRQYLGFIKSDELPDSKYVPIIEALCWLVQVLNAAFVDDELQIIIGHTAAHWGFGNGNGKDKGMAAAAAAAEARGSSSSRPKRMTLDELDTALMNMNKSLLLPSENDHAKTAAASAAPPNQPVTMIIQDDDNDDPQLQAEAPSTLPDQSQDQIHNAGNSTPKLDEKIIKKFSQSIRLCAERIDEQSDEIQTLLQSFELELPLLNDTIRDENENRKESIRIFANFFDSKIEWILQGIKRFETVADLTRKLELDMMYSNLNVKSLFDISNEHFNVQKQLDDKIIEANEYMEKHSQELNDLRENIQSLKTDHLKDNSSTREFIEKILQRLHLVNNQSQTIGHSLKQLAHTIYNIRAKLDNLTADYSTFKANLDASKLQTNIDKCVESTLANEFDISTLKQENAELKAKVEQLEKRDSNQQQSTALLNEMKDLRAKTAELYMDKNNKERLIQQMFTRLSKLEEQNAVLSVQVKKSSRIPLIPNKRSSSNSYSTRPDPASVIVIDEDTTASSKKSPPNNINTKGEKTITTPTKINFPNTDVLKKIKLTSMVSDEENSQQDPAAAAAATPGGSSQKKSQLIVNE
jgi:uncharacterized protein (UPF0305 family)